MTIGRPRTIAISLLCAVVFCLLSVALSSGDLSAQLLPPPRDGDIRVVYWELQNRTDVFLTLEPKTTSGKPAPPLMLLTLTFGFPGKIPKGPPERVDLRASPGRLWAPRTELSLAIDGKPVELAPAGSVGLGDGGLDYVWTPISTSTLRQIADAKRVTINALGIELELTESQRAAVGAFLTRILSDNPGQFKR